MNQTEHDIAQAQAKHALVQSQRKLLNDKINSMSATQVNAMYNNGLYQHRSGIPGPVGPTGDEYKPPFALPNNIALESMIKERRNS